MDILMDFLKGNLLVVIMALSSLVEIAPIKVNPLSTIAKWWGAHSNNEVISRIQGLEKRMDALESKDDKRGAINARTRILRFADECYCGQLHSKDHFDTILDDIKVYEQYCRDHPEFENDKTKIAEGRIKEIYETHLKKRDFL